ncbi:uncharacterized protein [Hetaerina americana]|uniref:uncharacterized protein n=1 Tax=Hetaerina americana TaxID=62018 RepID=UPI003A7F2F26
MEDFEERALRTAPLRPKYFFRYVDDTFIVWPQGPEALTEFLGHMNSVHQNIQFTMETETNKRLPFLDILIEKKRDGSLGHQVYRKPTHTDLYLIRRSHHHPAQKRGVISTLVHRATSVSDREHLEAEIHHLRKTFQQNEYGAREINMALKRAFTNPGGRREEAEKAVARACIPFVSTISNKVSRILRKYKVETIHKPPRKPQSVLDTAKDKRGLKTSGVYRIPCE